MLVNCISVDVFLSFIIIQRQRRIVEDWENDAILLHMNEYGRIPKYKNAGYRHSYASEVKRR